MAEGVRRARRREVHLAAADIRLIMQRGEQRRRLYDMQRRRDLCLGGFMRREQARLARASEHAALNYRRVVAQLSEDRRKLAETRYVLAHLYRAKRSLRVQQAVELLLEAAARIQ
jgi:hypothetical protein